MFSFFFIGGPGSGKGTLCGLLINNHNFFHVSAGELLRKEVKSGSKMGLEIEKTMKNGELVDVVCVTKILFKKFKYYRICKLLIFFISI